MFKFLTTLVEHISVLLQAAICLAFLVCFLFFIIIVIRLCWFFLLIALIIAGVAYLCNEGTL